MRTVEDGVAMMMETSDATVIVPEAKMTLKDDQADAAGADHPDGVKIHVKTASYNSRLDREPSVLQQFPRRLRLNNTPKQNAFNVQ